MPARASQVTVVQRIGVCLILQTRNSVLFDAIEEVVGRFSQPRFTQSHSVHIFLPSDKPRPFDRAATRFSVLHHLCPAVSCSLPVPCRKPAHLACLRIRPRRTDGGLAGPDGRRLVVSAVIYHIGKSTYTHVLTHHLSSNGNRGLMAEYIAEHRYLCWA